MKTKIEKEVERRTAQGHAPMKMYQIEDALKGIGYRLDKTSKASCMARYVAGPCVGESYPSVMYGVVDIETGRSFAHYAGRRDSRFDRLQEMRYNQECYAVVGNSIVEF